MTEMSRRIERVRGSSLFGYAQKSFWGFSDQAVVSMTNFVTMVLLARELSPDAYGAFVLVYGVLLFLNNMQVGLFTQPHNVLGAIRQGEADAYARYTTTTFVSQLAFVVVLVELILIAALSARLLDWSVTPLLFALAPAAITWQVQEFVRRVYYTEGRVNEAFFNDLLSYGGQTVGLAVAWRAGVLSGPLALYILAATSGVAALVGIWRLRSLFRREFDHALVRENWNFGKWLFGANVVQSSSIQLHLVLIAAIVGVAGTGLYRAVQNLVAPTHIIMNAVKSMAMPRAAYLYNHGGTAAMRAYLVRVVLLALVPIAGYLVLAGIFAEQLLDRFYSGQYHGYAPLVWIFSLAYLMVYVIQMLTLTLSAMRVTRAVLIAEASAVVAGIVVGVPLLLVFDVYGAVVTDLVTGAVLIGVMGFFLYRLIGPAGFRRDVPAFAGEPLVDGLRGDSD